jgi:hypothetical protein
VISAVMSQVYRNAIYLAIERDRIVDGWYKVNSPGKTHAGSERLTESLLGLIVFVALPFVEFVGAIADHI